ncbi:type I restriction enzyme HsdR N-terminal domain-containing protein [[Phormidium ambiguum] IAM M-71]|nr:type I restriction enzyme HsdR N-terminal domain-containing protein [Phormidium ambiguum]
METANFIPQRQIDIIAYNSEEQAILIAEVKALGFKNSQAKQQAFSQLKSYWQSWHQVIPFVMLAYHWKSQKPPASDQVEKIGLLQQLANGTTKSEVVLESDSVS